MTKRDSVRLLRECDAGADMAIYAMEVTGKMVHSRALRKVLRDCRQHHLSLKARITEQLNVFSDDGKALPSMTKLMAWMKIRWRMLLSPSDRTAAQMLIRGCRMGTGSLQKYLDQYPAAIPAVRALAEELICSEEQLCEQLHPFLYSK